MAKRHEYEITIEEVIGLRDLIREKGEAVVSCG